MQEIKDTSDTEKDRLIRQYRDELYRVYTSRSWRYTAPFRKLDAGVRTCISRCYFIFFRKPLKAFYYLLPGRWRSSSCVETLKKKLNDYEF